MSASVLVPNTTRDLICKGDLNIIIVSSKNNSTFKVGNKLAIRSSNGSKPHEKLFNELAETGYYNSLQVDEYGDYYTLIEKVAKFQVSIYSKEKKKFDIFIDDLYLTAKEQEAFISEQGMSIDEFLDRYGKSNNYYGYLLKFSL